jgi:replication factor A1
VVVDKKRVDGSRVRLAEVEVGDETGTVSLRARDEQIDVLREISERSGAVVLRNCTLELFQGKHIRVAVTKWGKLTPYPDHIASTPPPPSKINRDRNFSLINLCIVALDLVQPTNTT